MPSHNDWPEETVTLMLQLIADGESCSQVGSKIGKSRNAVIGKLHRMEAAGRKVERRGAALKQGSAPAKGIRVRPAPSLHSVALSGVPAVKRGRPFNPRSVAPALPPPIEPLPFVNGARITLMELTAKTCRWPMGDPGTEEFCFCGHAPRENSSYCDFHARAAYQPLQNAKHRVFG